MFYNCKESFYHASSRHDNSSLTSQKLSFADGKSSIAVLLVDNVNKRVIMRWGREESAERWARLKHGGQPHWVLCVRATGVCAQLLWVINCNCERQNHREHLTLCEKI